MAASFSRVERFARSTSPARAGQLAGSFWQSVWSATMRSSTFGSFSSTVTTPPAFAFSLAPRTFASSTHCDFGKRP